MPFSRNPLHAGLNPPRRIFFEDRQAIPAGFCATDGHEPRQVRKEAAINDAVCVVEGPGPFCASFLQTRFDWGCTTSRSFSCFKPPPRPCIIKTCQSKVQAKLTACFFSQRRLQAVPASAFSGDLAITIRHTSRQIQKASNDTNNILTSLQTVLFSLQKADVHI